MGPAKRETMHVGHQPGGQGEEERETLPRAGFVVAPGDLLCWELCRVQRGIAPDALFKRAANPPGTGGKRAEWRPLCVSRAMRGTLVRNCPFVSPVRPHTETPPENLARCLEEGFPRLKIKLKIASRTLPCSSHKAP